jgi:hypothetical protein
MHACACMYLSLSLYVQTYHTDTGVGVPEEAKNGGSHGRPRPPCPPQSPSMSCCAHARTCMGGRSDGCAGAGVRMCSIAGKFLSVCRRSAGTSMGYRGCKAGRGARTRARDGLHAQAVAAGAVRRPWPAPHWLAARHRGCPGPPAPWRPRRHRRPPAAPPAVAAADPARPPVRT